MPTILSKEQVESLIYGFGRKLTKAERDAIPTLGQILDSHEALRKRVAELETNSEGVE